MYLTAVEGKFDRITTGNSYSSQIGAFSIRPLIARGIMCTVGTEWVLLPLWISNCYYISMVSCRTDKAK